MEKIKKSNKGATLADLVIACIIIILLGGTIITSFMKIYTEIMMVRLNALAINTAINILEKVDELPYKDIDNNLDIDDLVEVNNGVEYEFSVKNYNENDNTKQDVIKIVTLKVKYSIQNKEEQVIISKLKVREI